MFLFLCRGGGGGGRVSEKESALIKTANTHLIQSLNLPEGDDNKKKKSTKEGREKLS